MKYQDNGRYFWPVTQSQNESRVGRTRYFLAVLAYALSGLGAWASDGLVPPPRQEPLTAARAPLIVLQPAAPGIAARGSLGSLFAGRQGTSLFAPVPRLRTSPLGPAGRGAGAQIASLRRLIGQAEAGSKGYDAVQHGAAVPPARRPTQLTLAEIYQWIDETPGQPHAIGRYQFIPETLRRLAARAGLDAQTVFSPDVQDRLANLLLDEAGLDAFSRGGIGRHAFMHNLAKIWAGLPTASGLSYYHGYAGNRATMTWAHFDLEMARIFPRQSAQETEAH